MEISECFDVIMSEGAEQDRALGVVSGAQSGVGSKKDIEMSRLKALRNRYAFDGKT